MSRKPRNKPTPRRQDSPAEPAARIDGETLLLEGSLTRDSVPPLFSRFRKEGLPPKIKGIDLSQITHMDTAGAAFVEWLASHRGDEGPARLMTETCSEEIRTLLEEFTDVPTAKAVQTPPPSRKNHHGLLEGLGAGLLKRGDALRQFLILLAEIVTWSLAGIVQWKQRKKNSVFEQCWLIGVQSLPLVALLSVILGLILSLQSALQLRNFGANIFVADLMAISMVTEMGPMMTAILVAGRSGSAIASEVATMKVSEEIDALLVMGIDPIRYVITPKFLAMTLSLPFLVIFSIYLGIGGGVVVGYLVLDIMPVIFIARCTSAIMFSTVLRSLFKSMIFGWIIVIIGSHFGFSVSGGAEGVGTATTKAVVFSIIAVILVDAVFSLTFLGGA